MVSFKRSQIFFSIVLLGFFLLGLWVVAPKQGHEIHRDPAAISQGALFPGSSSLSSVKKTILSGVKIKESSDVTELLVGSFNLRNASGQLLFACQAYKEIRLKFQAQGHGTSEGASQMTVTGDCQTQADGWSMQALRLPVRRILAEPAGDSEFSFQDLGSVRVSFENMNEAWPREWVLTQISFLPIQAESSILEIPFAEISKLSADPIIVRF